MAKKARKTKEKKNETKDLTEIIPEGTLDDIFTNLTKDHTDEKRMTFYLYWLFGLPIKTCAEKAGYSESYAYNLVSTYRKQPKLRHKVDEILNMFPDRYRSVCRLRLPQIAEIESKALSEYEDNPQLAISKPQLLRQVKQGAGAIGEDHPYQPTTINVGNLQVLMNRLGTGSPEEQQAISDALGLQGNPKPIDAEVIDNDELGDA